MRSYVNRRFLCLDMLPVQWQSCGAESSDAAILLEVGRLGGLLQTSIEVPVHKRVTLTLPNGTISAKVNSCKKDAFGYLVNIAVENSADWFPRSWRSISDCRDASANKEDEAPRALREPLSPALSAHSPQYSGRRLG